MSIQGVQRYLIEEVAPATAWQRDEARRAIDELFSLAGQYKSTKEYFQLLKFVGRFRFYSPFNAMLVHTQMTGATYVAPPHRWLREYGRRIKVGARPLVILQPKGPVMFVFDVADTEPEKGAPPLPPEVEKPFEVRKGHLREELWMTIENAKRDGISITRHEEGAQSAGSIRKANPNKQFQVLSKSRPKKEYVTVPVRYELLLNSKHSTEAQYATLVHELAHLYCGHLGTPNEKWWPDRRGLNTQTCEFEAESVSHLICRRLSIDSPSAEYLAGYLRTHEGPPEISLDCVMKASGLIERMGSLRLKPRKENE